MHVTPAHQAGMLDESGMFQSQPKESILPPPRLVMIGFMSARWLRMLRTRYVHGSKIVKNIQKWDTNGRTALVVSCLKHDRCKPYVAHYCPDLLWHAQTLNTLWLYDKYITLSWFVIWRWANNMIKTSIEGSKIYQYLCDSMWFIKRCCSMSWSKKNLWDMTLITWEKVGLSVTQH